MLKPQPLFSSSAKPAKLQAKAGGRAGEQEDENSFAPCTNQTPSERRKGPDSVRLCMLSPYKQ